MSKGLRRELVRWAAVGGVFIIWRFIKSMIFSLSYFGVSTGGLPVVVSIPQGGKQAILMTMLFVYVVVSLVVFYWGLLEGLYRVKDDFITWEDNKDGLVPHSLARKTAGLAFIFGGMLLIVAPFSMESLHPCYGVAWGNELALGIGHVGTAALLLGAWLSHLPRPDQE